MHRLIKKKIEEGDGLPDMATQEECVQALRDVGFEVSVDVYAWVMYIIQGYMCGAIPMGSESCEETNHSVLSS